MRLLFSLRILGTNARLLLDGIMSIAFQNVLVRMSEFGHHKVLIINHLRVTVYSTKYPELFDGEFMQLSAHIGDFI